MKEKITAAIQEKFNIDKIEIKDHDNKISIKLNKRSTCLSVYRALGAN